MIASRPTRDRPDDYQRVARAIAHLQDRFQQQPCLEELARAAGLSPYHFQRLFSRWAGISPKRFLQFLTLEYAKRRLREDAPVLDAAFDSGLSGPGRLHDLFVRMEAVTPGEFKALGRGLRVAYGFHGTPFGQSLVAVTPRGICGLRFLTGRRRGEEVEALRRGLPGADFVQDGPATRSVAEDIFYKRKRFRPSHLTLFVKGTNFQIQVWRALLQTPEGALCSYGDLARAVGRPSSARAVAGAVASNPVAYLIPCHRVIRGSGLVGDYRWGKERKQAMIAWEAARCRAGAAG